MACRRQPRLKKLTGAVRISSTRLDWRARYTQAGGMEGLAAVLVPLAGYAAVLLSVRYLNRHDDVAPAAGREALPH
ncbi:Hypothetical protein ERS075653_00070 [Mycobacteroides abscessus]|nr:Hypothetical protein ERS075653_00070 [Mycobacteroides abscessus]SIN28884.1 Uncharacterised protein [Mycobacteroides abscessus subsp. abscessus]SKT83030.1 Uncharacterised protein [Mycobacteroides abscessus subsp. abscessus]SKX37174.1 Uncharacterised protein [Mycobacteroides abscessus subsp. abscessus]SKY40396.1 Uncharacterised protein [Mycobacteroides abscessus subsp. abscessus]